MATLLTFIDNTKFFSLLQRGRWGWGGEEGYILLFNTSVCIP